MTHVGRGLLALCALLSGCRPEPGLPSPCGHAHNDYAHDRPLLDALDLGFCSVEADVVLSQGELFIAHEEEAIEPSRTLESLYLEPLDQRIEDLGAARRDGGTLILLVDVKTDATATYLALHELLGRFDFITTISDGVVTRKAVDVVISGNRDPELMAAQSVRFAGYDGRLADIASDAPAHLMPMISDDWYDHFVFSGVGEPGDQDRRLLEDSVRDSHDKGRLLRFWGTLDEPLMWQALFDAHVDLINTDDLEGYSDWEASR
jgi:Glycerophosphoryl diester phosphodiesterase family